MQFGIGWQIRTTELTASDKIFLQIICIFEYNKTKQDYESFRKKNLNINRKNCSKGYPSSFNSPFVQLFIMFVCFTQKTRIVKHKPQRWGFFYVLYLREVQNQPNTFIYYES